MKKILTLLLALLLTASLASCGGDESSSSSKVESGSVAVSESSTEEVKAMELDTDEDISIDFWHTMGNTGDKYNALLKGIQDFEETYPNITVEEKSTGGGYDDCRDAIVKGIQIKTTPNLAYAYPDHVALYNTSDRTRVLDDFINDPTYGFNGDDIDDFVPAFYAEGSSFGDDSMYLLPFSKSTEVLYYNETAFTDNGWTVPTSWDEVWAVSKTILESETGQHKDSTGAVIPVIPFAIDSGANWFITMTEQLGTTYTSLDENGEGSYDFNTEANRAQVAALKEAYEKGYMTSKGAYGNFINVNSENPLFYMAVGSSAGCTYHVPKKIDGDYPFQVGIATIPQFDQDNKKVISQGPDVVMLKSYNEDSHMAEQEELASWLFMKFITGTDFSAQFSMASGYIPVRESSIETAAYKTFLAKADGTNNNDNIKALAAKIAMDQADFYYTSVSFDGSSLARSEVETLITQSLTATDKTIADLFADAISNCEY